MEKIPSGSAEAPHIELSALGELVQAEWQGIPRYYPQIEVMALQLMSDHLHGILFVHESVPVHLGHVLGGFKKGCERKWQALMTGTANLADNPRRLLLKRARPEFLRPHFHIETHGHTFATLGNLQLLTMPCRLQVRVSRRCTPAQVQAEVARYLTAARAGAVLVSPSISPGEKAVMRAAFDAHLPLIVLVENGFTPLTKPQGEQFDACAAGRLLLLAPWDHHNERRTITAWQCQQLNLMATAICEG